MAFQWGERIPLGVIYRGRRPPFGEGLPPSAREGLVGRDVDGTALAEIQERFA